MKTELANLKKAIAAETIETPALQTSRALFNQLSERLAAHAADAQKIAEKKEADKAAEVANAAKIVADAEAEKLSAAKKLEQQAEAAANPATETAA